MINKIFITLVLFFSFVAECKSQDTLKVADSTNQDSTTTEDVSVTYTLVENCKCNYVKIPLVDIPKNLYEDDIDIVVWSYKPTYYSRIITPAKDTLWSL